MASFSLALALFGFVWLCLALFGFGWLWLARLGNDTLGIGTLDCHVGLRLLLK